MKINNWAKCLILHRFVSEWIKWSFIIIDALIFFKVSLRYFETEHIQACFSSKSAVSLWCLTAKLNAALLLLLLIRRYHQTHRRPFIIKWSLATVCLSFVFNAREKEWSEWSDHHLPNHFGWCHFWHCLQNDGQL